MTLTPTRHSRLASLLVAIATALLCALPASAQVAPSPAKGSAQSEQALPAGKVNLNSASEDELTRLPGIGPSKAAKIVKLRQRMKRFKRIEDLMRVKGIGRKTFRKLRPMLTLEGATTLQAPTKKRK